MAENVNDRMEKLVALCKRRGFIFQSSEIYGGIGGFWDYGPLGVELKRNIKAAWWADIVRGRDDMVGLDCSIIMNPKVWEASGHVGGFCDPMVDCKESKKRYRADQLWVRQGTNRDGNEVYVCIIASAGEEAAAAWRAVDETGKLPKDYQVVIAMKRIKFTGSDEAVSFMDISAEQRERTIGPDCQTPGTLTEPRQFNLMFQTCIGAVQDADSIAYLRPETAQGIFANYKNVLRG